MKKGAAHSPQRVRRRQKMSLALCKLCCNVDHLFGFIWIYLIFHTHIIRTIKNHTVAPQKTLREIQSLALSNENRKQNKNDKNNTRSINLLSNGRKSELSKKLQQKKRDRGIVKP